MIRIFIVEEKNSIARIVLKGHADYQEYGKDIVCAAVSATYLCTVNACFSIKEDAILVNSNSEAQEILVVKVDEVIQKLLRNMILCFESLQKQYSKNIKIDKEEK